MATAAELQVKANMFIGGEWPEPEGAETIEVVNSTTEETMGTIPACTPADADRAVRAAREAFEPWSQTSREERRGYLRGVLGPITPWNYPLNQIAAKVAPALAAGCTVVLKPSEVVPLNAFILAEVIEAARLPAGVFNLVPGTGPVVGEAIAGPPGVDMVSFTGSTRAGRRVSELASATVKPVAM